MNFDLLAMLQFSIAAGAVIGLGVWLLYFLFIRPALRKQNLQRLGEATMNLDLAEAEEAEILATFRVLPNERRKIAVRLLEALK